MSRTLRTAVIGVGHLGTYHARIHAANPRCELVGVVDTRAEQRDKLAEECGCPGFADVSELPDDLDAVSVVVPTKYHADVAVPLLERGVACLVEKPLAGDIPSADLILAAAARGNATLSVGHVERFQPGLRKVKEMGIAPRFIECHRLAPFSFRSMDVGVVHDLMIHDLDLILHLVDSEVETLDAAGGAILTDHEDLASVRLVFANGARANITASRASLDAMRRFRLFSSQGYVSLDFNKNYGLSITKGPEWEAGREALRTMDTAEFTQSDDWLQDKVLKVAELELGEAERPLQAEIDSFLQAVQDGTEPEVTGADGRRALALADRIKAAIAAQSF